MGVKYAKRRTTVRWFTLREGCLIYWLKRKLKGRILTDFEMAQIQVKSEVLLHHCYLPVRTVHTNRVNLHVSLINDVKR